MILGEQVYAQASLLAGELEEKERELLKLFSAGAVSALAARLREGLMPEDCQGDFVAAASLYALAALGCASESWDIQEFRAGDLTVKQGEGGKALSSQSLKKQADEMMAPYLRDRFAFQGV